MVLGRLKKEKSEMVILRVVTRGENISLVINESGIRRSIIEWKGNLKERCERRRGELMKRKKQDHRKLLRK